MNADITLVFEVATHQHDVVGYIQIGSYLNPWVTWLGLTKNLVDNVTEEGMGERAFLSNAGVNLKEY